MATYSTTMCGKSNFKGSNSPYLTKVKSLMVGITLRMSQQGHLEFFTRCADTSLKEDPSITTRLTPVKSRITIPLKCCKKTNERAINLGLRHFAQVS